MPSYPRRLLLCLLVLCFGFAGANKACSQVFSFSTPVGDAGYGSADGVGSAARFNFPQGVAVDSSGNVFVADSQNSLIREIALGGVVSTIAGSPGLSGSTDGTGASARFSFPQGIAVDGATNVYVADTRNHTIRKLSPSGAGWQVTTLAGQAGVAGASNGIGTNAQFRFPAAVTVDQSGRLYVADTYNDAVRLMTPSTTNWAVTLLAGVPGVSGNSNALGTAATFSLPWGIAVDASNIVFVADTGNEEIREIVPGGTNWAVSTLVSNGLFGGIAIAGSGNLVAADSDDDSIVKITYSGQITNFAGTSGAYGSADGVNGAASFNFPQGVAADLNGFVYVADSLNNTIRKITLVGAVSTLAGLAGGPGGADGTNAFARFSAPRGLAADGQSNVYVADNANQTIRKVARVGTNWVVNTLAGQAGISGDADGTNDGAQFNSPSAVALDNGNNLFVADSLNNQIREITPSGTNWVVSARAGRSGVFYSGTITNTEVVTDVAGGMTNLVGYTNLSFVLTNRSAITNFSGLLTNLSGGSTNVVFVVTNLPAVTNVVAGVTNVVSLNTNFFTLTTVAQFLDGPANLALFSAPSGVGFDPFGNLYVADRGNNCIRQINPAGLVSTFAGSPLAQGATDGAGTNALFFHPSGLVLDANGNIFVTDTGNATVREVTTAGVVTTLAGLAGFSGAADGTNHAARFGSPQAITIDESGNLYVADSAYNTIRKITPSGTNWVVTTVGGLAGVHGSFDGVGTNALFFGPQGLTTDTGGNLYVADTGNNTLRLGQFVLQTPPAMQISSLPQQVVLTWPASASGFVLETSGSLSPGAVWIDLNGVTVVGTNFVWTNAAAGAGAYFRLRSP